MSGSPNIKNCKKENDYKFRTHREIFLNSENYTCLTAVRHRRIIFNFKKSLETFICNKK